MEYGRIRKWNVDPKYRTRDGIRDGMEEGVESEYDTGEMESSKKR